MMFISVQLKAQYVLIPSDRHHGTSNHNIMYFVHMFWPIPVTNYNYYCCLQYGHMHVTKDSARILIFT